MAAAPAFLSPLPCRPRLPRSRLLHPPPPPPLRCCPHRPRVHVSASTPAPSSTSSPLSREALLHLQNGSDVRGVASPLHPSEPVTLTASAVREILHSYVLHVSSLLSKPPHQLRVALGRDSRISGPLLIRAAAEGVISANATPVIVDLCTTPAMFMATVLQPYVFDAACMLTASHLPPNRNGIKFFTAQGSANKTQIKSILSNASDNLIQRTFQPLPTLPPHHSFDTLNFLPVYANHLVQLIRAGCHHPTHYDAPLTGFVVVVDAGNGAAGFFAHLVLSQLGAQVIGQFLEPDGMFPNHVPNPEDPTAMAMTVDTVLRHKADIGVVFDTDVDRSGVVDSNGLAINRNRLIALLARIVLRQYPGSTIVTDSVTSNGLTRFIEQFGGKHFRYRKGYKNVIDKGIELDAAGLPTQLAIETSGHGAMKENYMLDDGAYLAVKILIEMVKLRLSGDTKGIGGLLDGLDSPKEEKEFRLRFLDQTDFQAYGAAVVEAFAEFAKGVDGWTVEKENYEGYRVSVDEGEGKAGWLLLRQSLHDPLLPLNVESEVDGGIATILKVLVDQFFPRFDNVSMEQLNNHLAQ